jgi:hypothetical protein
MYLAIAKIGEFYLKSAKNPIISLDAASEYVLLSSDVDFIIT